MLDGRVLPLQPLGRLGCILDLLDLLCLDLRLMTFFLTWLRLIELALLLLLPHPVPDDHSKCLVLVVDLIARILVLKHLDSRIEFLKLSVLLDKLLAFSLVIQQMSPSVSVCFTLPLLLTSIDLLTCLVLGV